MLYACLCGSENRPPKKFELIWAATGFEPVTSCKHELSGPKAGIIPLDQAATLEKNDTIV